MTRPRTGLPYLDEGIERGHVLAFAHRGGALHPEVAGLENTLVAFEHAVAMGYTYLETDVHATSDGRLLAFHDSVLDRVTSSMGTLAEMAYADVRAALVGGREPIPLIDDLLEHFPHCRFNIDLKSSASTALLADLVERTGAHDRVCVGAFDEGRQRAFQKLVSRRVATAFGPRDVVVNRVAPGRLADRLMRGRGDALQVPHRHRGALVVTPTFVRRAHAGGRPVHVWTVDDAAEMEQLLDHGVDGLFTDRTDVLRDVLVARGQWGGGPVVGP